MKHLLLVVTLATFTILSCNTNTEKNNAHTTNESDNNAALHQDLKQILISNDKVVRNVDFTMSNHSVTSTESATLLKNEDGLLTYSTDLDDQSFLDITYHLVNDKVSKIQIDIFSKDESTVNHIMKNLESHFDKNYKKRSHLWDGTFDNSDFTVFMKRMDDTQENYGIYLVYEKY